MVLDPLVGLFVGRNQRAARARFNREVAQHHALFDGKGFNDGAAVLNDRAQGAARRDAAQNVEHEILGVGALGHRARDADAHRRGKPVDKRLGGENVFNFRGADAKAQRSESAVRGGVAVAADDDHARAHESLLLHDDVLDPLVGALGAVEGFNAEVLAVLLHVERLLERGLVIDSARLFVVGRDDVVDDAQVRVGNEHGKAALTHTGEGLRRGVFVGKVHVAVKKHSVVVNARNGVRLDELGVERAGLRLCLSGLCHGENFSKQPAEGPKARGRQGLKTFASKKIEARRILRQNVKFLRITIRPEARKFDPKQKPRIVSVIPPTARQESFSYNGPWCARVTPPGETKASRASKTARKENFDGDSLQWHFVTW